MDRQEKISLDPFPASIEPEIVKELAGVSGIRYQVIGTGLYRTAIIESPNGR